jgi:hypothetical protein
MDNPPKWADSGVEWQDQVDQRLEIVRLGKRCAAFLKEPFQVFLDRLLTEETDDVMVGGSFAD